MNIKLLTCALALGCALSSSLSTVAAPAIPRDENLERRVTEILNSMTLEEKIGQMCEINIDVLLEESADGIVFNKEKLDEVLVKYKVGSILNAPFTTSRTPREWSGMIRELNEVSARATGGLSEIYGVDQIHGASYTSGATIFPQEIGQAASFNRDIPYRASQIAAYESRACLIPWVYSPVLDLARNPLWSRLWESYGEDSYLNGVMASRAVKGYQGDYPNRIPYCGVAACLKHYMAYGAATTGKDRTPSRITDREMREKFFEPFRVAVNSGALSLMVNSGVNDGVPFHASYKYLTEWLKNDLEWDGMIVTDWGDIDNIWKRDHVAATRKDAICMAINAGVDMSMDPYNLDFCDLLLELVNEGRVSMQRIDDAVSRIIRMKLRLGLDDKSVYARSDKVLEKEFPLFGSGQFAEEAASMTAECLVLLKNESSVLPLEGTEKIFVCGPNADNLRGMNGGWSYTWQGHRTNELTESMGYYPTFFKALRDRFGEGNVVYEEGVRWSQGNFDSDSITADLTDLRRRAAECDVIIACIGENSYCETPGNIADLNLSSNQKLLVEELSKTGRPIVLVLAEGRPRILHEIEPLAQGIVQTFLPGNYGGVALARLLSGEENFSGRLPYTYPKYTGSLHVYDYKPSENMDMIDGAYNYDAVMDVQWPFGHGLSYTEFEYSNLRCDRSMFDAEDTLKLTVDITNRGARRGKHSVLFFSSDLVASISPDVRKLCAFDKIELEPGETGTVTVDVPASRFAFVGEDLKWRIEEGDFRIATGNQSIIVKCGRTYVWPSPNF